MSTGAIAGIIVAVVVVAAIVIEAGTGTARPDAQDPTMTQPDLYGTAAGGGTGAVADVPGVPRSAHRAEDQLADAGWAE